MMLFSFLIFSLLWFINAIDKNFFYCYNIIILSRYGVWLGNILKCKSISSNYLFVMLLKLVTVWVCCPTWAITLLKSMWFI